MLLGSTLPVTDTESLRVIRIPLRAISLCVHTVNPLHAGRRRGFRWDSPGLRVQCSLVLRLAIGPGIGHNGVPATHCYIFFTLLSLATCISLYSSIDTTASVTSATPRVDTRIYRSSCSQSARWSKGAMKFSVTGVCTSLKFAALAMVPRDLLIRHVSSIWFS
jgi:hypothetical protein